MRPTLFIGSSSEGLACAQGMRSLLVDNAEVTVWNEGIFGVGDTTIDSLVNALPRFDFAAVVLTPDDLTSSREVTRLGPRDNAIFELGLFMGRLGRSRTFIVRPRGTDLKLPTDLAGVNAALYDWPRSDGDHRAAVGVACDDLRRVIWSLGPTDARVDQRLTEVRAEQQRQKREIDVLSFMLAHFLSTSEHEHLVKLESGAPFPFKLYPALEREFMHLWGLRFIRRIEVGGVISELPPFW